VTSRVDYCNVVLAGAPKVITNRLQRDECGGPRSDRFQEVRPRFDAADAWQSPLAWRVWARQVQSHRLDSSLPHRYRATVSSCRLCSGFRDGTPLVISSSCRRTDWTHVASKCFLYSVRDCGTLRLDCCVTLATTLLALVILWRHSFSQCTSAYSALGALTTMRYTNLRFTYLLTYLLIMYLMPWCSIALTTSEYYCLFLHNDVEIE